MQKGWSARIATHWSSHRPACSVWYRSLHVSSSADESFFFTGTRSRRPHHSHFSHGRQNCRSSFCSGRGESLETIARFGKPLFANIAPPRSCCSWGTTEAKLCMPAPRRLHRMASDLIDAEFALCRCQCVALNRPFAQLLPGLEKGHPVTVGQSPAYDFSVSDEQICAALVSVFDCSECDSYADD